MALNYSWTVNNISLKVAAQFCCCCYAFPYWKPIFRTLALSPHPYITFWLWGHPSLQKHCNSMYCTWYFFCNKRFWTGINSIYIPQVIVETPLSAPGILKSQLFSHQGELGMEEGQENKGRGRAEMSYGQKSQNFSAWSAETDLACNWGHVSTSYGEFSSIYTQAPL